MALSCLLGSIWLSACSTDRAKDAASPLDGGEADSTSARVCAPGLSIACVGPLGCAGYQVCGPSGTQFSPCDCGGGADAVDAGVPSAIVDATTDEAPDATMGSTDATTAEAAAVDAAQDDGTSADVTQTDGASPDAQPTALSGAIQKGPFVRGSSVTVQELDATLTPTGRSFEVSTSDDEGDFEVPGTVTSQYVELVATGYYFDELTNQLSSAPLTLHALADLHNGTTVEVTLLTSMSEPLVRNLVAGGATFASATTQAESAVLSALGFSSSSLGASFSTIPLTGSGAASGEALAASLIVEQYARSLGTSEVAQLSQLLGQVGAATVDSGGDATLAALNAALCPTIWAIAPGTVRTNLTSYYASLGATVVVPPFEQFLCGCGVWCGGDGGAATCIDPSTDSNNCGGCGRSCSIANATVSCVGGSCTHTCNAGYAACDGGTPCAYDTNTDPGHCGSSCATCQNACVGGSCGGVCVSGATRCSGNGVQTCDSSGAWGPVVTCLNQTCASGACVGVCSPDQTQCSGGGLQTCTSSGTWGAAVTCPGSSSCSHGACETTAAMSCQSADAGLANCGGSDESCCTSIEVSGGTFYRAYTNDGTGPTGESGSATISGFRFDKYDVTVGRFRQFVSAWAAGWTPPAGSGKHTHLNGGQGLVDSSGDAGVTYEPGWHTSDNSNIAPTDPNLTCDMTFVTWTSSPGGQDNLPINCVNWYEAYAFCIWDGGFLPSDAEWEYAAAGGDEQREYPWGSAAPGNTVQYAVYNGIYGYSGGVGCVGTTTDCIPPVGTATLGAGRWGQLDLVGEIFTWDLDWYGGYTEPCVDCTHLTPYLGRLFRGSDWGQNMSQLPVTASVFPHYIPTVRYTNIGFRCARVP